MKHHPCIYRLSFSFACFVALAGGAAGDSPPQKPVTFDTVLAYALSTSPLVKEVDSALSTRLSESLEIKQYLNPQVGAGVGLPADPAGDADKRQISLTLSQPLRPSDFGARQAVAALLSSVAGVEQKLSLLELSQSVYLSYAKLWVLQEQRKFLDEQRERARRISQNVTMATTRGALGNGEGGLFAAEYKKRSVQLLGLDADVARERANLLRLSTFSIEGGTVASPEKNFKVSAETLLSNLDEGALPIQSRYALRAKVASERENLARRDALPALSPQLSYQRTEDGGNFVGVGVQFELPLFNRNQAEIQRRQAEALAARAQSTYSESHRFREEVTMLLQSIEALRMQAETFEKEVIPSLSSALKGYDKQFSVGTGNVLSLWQVQREISNAQLESLELWMRYFASRSDLSILTGQQL